MTTRSAWPTLSAILWARFFVAGLAEGESFFGGAARSLDVRGSVRLRGVLGDRALEGFLVGVADGLGAFLLLHLFERIERGALGVDRFGLS